MSKVVKEDKQYILMRNGQQMYVSGRARWKSLNSLIQTISKLTNIEAYQACTVVEVSIITKHQEMPSKLEEIIKKAQLASLEAQEKAQHKKLKELSAAKEKLLQEIKSQNTEIKPSQAESSVRVLDL